MRLVSRNQNDLTGQFSELGGLPKYVKADRAILDGEIVALDDEGRPSFSLMQQRTGFQPGQAATSGTRRRVPSSITLSICSTSMVSICVELRLSSASNYCKNESKPERSDSFFRSLCRKGA